MVPHRTASRASLLALGPVYLGLPITFDNLAVDSSWGRR